MSVDRTWGRGRGISTFSRGSCLSSSLNSTPSSMSAYQYTMDLVFIMVTWSRSFGIQIKSPTESSTPLRLLANLIYPFGEIVQITFPTSPSSNRESYTPPPITYSQVVTLEKWFEPQLEIKTYFKKHTVIYDPIIELKYQNLILDEIVSKMFSEGFIFLLKDLKRPEKFMSLF